MKKLKKIKIRFLEEIYIDANIAITYIYFYLGPLILSFGDIFKNKRLNGDHIGQSFDTNFINLTGLSIIYLVIPIFLFFIPLLKIKQIRDINTLIWPKRISNKIILLIFSTLTVALLIFGLEPVGSAPTNFGAYILTFINPIFLILVIFFLSFNYLSLLFSNFLLLMVSFYSQSFLPIFFLFGINILYFFDKLKYKPKLQWFIILTTLLGLIIFAFSESDIISNLLEIIYTFRQDLRGSDIPIKPETVYGYAIGRFSSFSAMIYIIKSNISSLDVDFLSNLKVIFQPLLPDIMVNDLSKSFNDFLLGADRDWGTILSFPGMVYQTFKTNNSIFESAFDLLIYFLFVGLLANLFPKSNYLNKLVIILFFSFQGILSGIFYEFFNLAKSLLVISLILMIFRKSKKSYKY